MAAVVSAASLASGDAAAQGTNYVQRLRLQAQLQTLNADLLSHDSATAVLQALCDRRDPAAPRILAQQVEVPDDLSAGNAARRQLGAAANEPLKRRSVELKCGEVVLSRADNWYLPSRLTAQMNIDLESTQRPFGVVVRPLNFQRRTLSSRLLFQPLPPGWEAADPAGFDVAVTVPSNVLQHRAYLQTADGRPFALLIETYSAATLLP